MIKIKRLADRFRLIFNQSGSQYNESLYERTILSNDGQNLIFSNNFDPNEVDIIIPFTSIIEPGPAPNVQVLQDFLQGWINEYLAPKAKAVILEETFEQLDCDNVLYNIGGQLYWNCNPIGTGGGGGLTPGTVIGEILIWDGTNWVPNQTVIIDPTKTFTTLPVGTKIGQFDDGVYLKVGDLASVKAAILSLNDSFNSVYMGSVNGALSSSLTMADQVTTFQANDIIAGSGSQLILQPGSLTFFNLNAALGFNIALGNQINQTGNNRNFHVNLKTTALTPGPIESGVWFEDGNSFVIGKAIGQTDPDQIYFSQITPAYQTEQLTSSFDITDALTTVYICDPDILNLDIDITISATLMIGSILHFVNVGQTFNLNLNFLPSPVTIAGDRSASVVYTGITYGWRILSVY
jgi:hypothetical protein